MSNERGVANSRQVGGSHYKVGGEEHWDRVARLGLDYFQGQVTKYVERWKLKNGVQDLEKARHFLDKYIELVVAGVIDNDGELETTNGPTTEERVPEPTGAGASNGEARGDNEDWYPPVRDTTLPL